MKKDRSVTIRLNSEVYDKMVELAIEKSVSEKRIVKISEIIREKLEK